MLNDYPVFASLPSKDLERSKEFYTKKLGLKAVPMPMDDPVFYGAGYGTRLVVYQKDNANTDHEHTACGFMVENIEDLVKYLVQKGVVFEDYDMPNLKTVDHLVDNDGMKAAFFKDPDGNILSINQM